MSIWAMIQLLFANSTLNKWSTSIHWGKWRTLLNLRTSSHLGWQKSLRNAWITISHQRWKSMALKSISTISAVNQRLNNICFICSTSLGFWLKTTIICMKNWNVKWINGKWISSRFCSVCCRNITLWPKGFRRKSEQTTYKPLNNNSKAHRISSSKLKEVRK